MSETWMAELLRVGRFASVGVAATLLHMGIALFLVAAPGWPNQLANLTAFFPAVVLSFFGHYHWSFRSNAPRRRAAVRFLAVSGTGFLASAGVIALLNRLLGPHHELAVIMGALAIPAVSYLANKFFVFR